MSTIVIERVTVGPGYMWPIGATLDVSDQEAQELITAGRARLKTIQQTQADSRESAAITKTKNQQRGREKR